MKTLMHRNLLAFRSLMALLALMLIGQWGYSQGSLGNYSTASLSGTPASITASGVATNVTFSTLTRGAGITGVSATGEFASQDFATGALNTGNNDYLQFTITPASCYKFSASAIRFSLYRGSQGPTQLVLRSSLDGYASNIGSAISPTTSTASYSITLSGVSGLQNSTSAVTLRLYGYSASTSAGSLRLDDNTDNGVEVDGTVAFIIANNTVSSAQSICSGSTPAGLTGTLPTGGSGSYTYVWQSSTTSATSGFASAAGTNTGQNYSPVALTQTTWFRRQATSSGCTDVSTAIQITVTQAPVANAGTNVNTCSNSGAVNITAGSSASNQASVQWSSSGTGSFANATSLTTATYTPSAADIAAGSVTLTLTAFPNSPCVTNATSQKTLTINAAPIANAGTAIATCSTSGAVNITTGASASNNASVTWSVTSGTGTLTNSTSLTNATYAPSAGDISAGSRTIVLTAVGNPGCSNATSNKTITITSAPTAAAGSNINTCSNSGAVNITTGATATNNSGITWSSSGTGSFANANSLTTATYTPSAADIAAGSVTITLTSAPNSPCAANATSNKTLTINTLPTADAGNAILTCSNSGTVNITSGASATNQQSISWSVTSGTGTLSNSTSLTTATYNPSAGDIAAGSRTIVLTALGKPGCSNVTDTKALNITAAPSASAGTAITTCANSGAVNITTGASAGNSAGVTWSSSGSGTFANANSLTTATYDPSSADIAAGSVTLTLTVTGNSPCAVATSTKTLTINPIPATTGVSICQGTASAALTSSTVCTQTGNLTAGPNFPGAGANSGSGTAWTNPGNVGANDNAYTSVTGVGTAFSQTLVASNYNLNIPANATIKGIQVTIGRYRNGGSFGEIQDNSLRLVKAGTAVGNNNGATSTNWPTSEAAANYGTTTDLWGTTWTAAELNASNFGVALVVDNTNSNSFFGTRNANVDYIQVTVTYTTPGAMNWYTVSSGGSVIGTGLSFDPVGVLNSGLSNTNTPGTTIYYAECATIPGCRTPTTYEILAAPAAPTASNQSVCEDGNPSQTLTATATGGSITWYDAASNGSVVANPVQTGVGAATYYAEASDGTCSSLTRTAVTLTINAAPVAVTSNQTVCSDGNPSQTLTATATGGTITWYDAATGGSVVANPEQVGVGSSTYYAEAFNGTCTSLTRAASTLTINPVPSAPISGGDQTVCSDGNPSQTLTTTATGSGITWYDQASNGNLVASPVQVGVGSSTYYAQSFDGTCSSLTRTAVSLTINAVPAAPSGSNQSVCTTGDPEQTLTATATGENVTWYDAASGGSIISNPTQVGVGSVTYYAEAYNGLCTSLTRTAITLTINPAPAAPVSGGDQAVCYNGNPLQTLTATATGGTITWYDAASNGNLVSPTQVGVGNSIYYAQASDGTCSSLTRTAVSLTINPAPVAVGANQSVCYSGNPTQTLTATATGGSITWYDAATNGNVVANPVQVGIGASTYYAEAFDGTCTSLTRAAVTLKINIPPATPAAIIGQKNVCPYVGTGDPITYSIAAVPFAETYRWTLPPYVNLVSASPDSTSITVTFDNDFGTSNNRQIRVRSISACGNSGQAIIYLVSQFASTPAPISGPTSVCPYLNNDQQATYTIRKVTAATSYLWTVPAGVTVIHPNGDGENDTTIVVTFDNSFATSNITVRSENDCGISAARSINIVRSQPPTPGLITGPTNACENVAPNGTPGLYSIRKVAGATGYIWTAPAGSVINHVNAPGENDTAITVLYPHHFNNGAVSVIAQNGCGSSVTPRNLAIGTLKPATPGIIDVIQIESCPNRRYSYTIATMPANATSVHWTVPAGAISFTGQGTTSIVVTYPSTAVEGNVTVMSVGNCSNSLARASSVRLPACPPDEGGKGVNEFAKGTSIAVAPTTNTSFNVQVYPNPSVNDFKLKVVTAEKETISVRILDLQGRELRKFTVMPYSTTTVGADLKAGTYMIETRQGTAVKVTKVIKF